MILPWWIGCILRLAVYCEFELGLLNTVAYRYNGNNLRAPASARSIYNIDLVKIVLLSFFSGLEKK